MHMLTSVASTLVSKFFALHPRTLRMHVKSFVAGIRHDMEDDGFTHDVFIP